MESLVSKSLKEAVLRGLNKNKIFPGAAVTEDILLEIRDYMAHVTMKVSRLEGEGSADDLFNIVFRDISATGEIK